MPKFKVTVPVRGRLTREVEARSRTEARAIAKREWEEMPLSPGEVEKVTGLTVGDVDDFQIEEVPADEPDA